MQFEWVIIPESIPNGPALMEPKSKPLGIPDDSQGMSDYLSILDCERKDLGKILHFCEEFAKYVENPVVKQEEEVEDDF